ncbi:MAG: hypothetical protein ACKV22_07175 [Bryobacteraceae bacterium]
MNDNTVVGGSLPEQGKAEGEVFVIEKDPLAFVATLDDVVEEVRLEVAARSRHGSGEATDGPKLEELVGSAGSVGGVEEQLGSGRPGSRHGKTAMTRQRG